MYNETKILLDFKSRQAFLGQIVFGFCLGLETAGRRYKSNIYNKLQDNLPTEGHDQFGKNCEPKPPTAGLTHSFPHSSIVLLVGERP